MDEVIFFVARVFTFFKVTYQVAEEKILTIQKNHVTMKKVLFLMLLLVATTAIANARVQSVSQLTATSFSIRTLERSYYGGTHWGDWSRDMSCCIDIYLTNTDQIIIDSNTPQIYNILGDFERYRDRQGYDCCSFPVRDQDGDRGTILLRSGHGYGQLYVKFANVMWVYEVK